MGGKHFLGRRTRQPGAELGFAGHVVDRVQLVEAAQVQRHHGAEVAAQGVEATDDAGATPERDDGDAALRAVRQDLRDLVLVGGEQYGIGRVLHANVSAPQQV
jgi:hypothetical protein